MPDLNEKEIMVASYAAKGLSVKQTAEAMFLSADTIKWYRKKLLHKYNATTVAELIALLKDEKII